MPLIEGLQWRHATKAYDPARKISKTDLDQILEAIRLAPTSSGLQQFRVLVAQTPQQHFEHAARQTYIGLGLALAQAAELKIDSTPAEGFDNQVVDRVLKLPEQGLRSVSLLYLGYRDLARDWLAPLKKVRNTMNEFVIYP